MTDRPSGEPGAEGAAPGSVDELIEAWDEMREFVDQVPPEHDRLVLQCARELAADPGGALAYRWTAGLVLALPFLAAGGPGEGVREEAFGAAQAVDRALRDEPCAHQEHPYQGNLAADQWSFAEILRDLGGGEPVAWVVPLPREQWLCPRNTAGCARVVMESLRPGSAEDVPPFLPFEDRYELDGLTAIMEGYPLGRTYDIAWDLTSAAAPLREADRDDLAGRVFVATAVAWYVEVEADGTVDIQELLDTLTEGFERARGLLDAGPCAHDVHPELPQDTTETLSVGMHLASARGRATYARWPEEWAIPLDTALCPAFVAATAEDSLRRLRNTP
ncbi:hypothetical protein G6045_28995 [Streptomyces sp. YC504]|uniref:Uncharacterized protein n=1 Tax=Streptomyces mesophilus TaxID=1775132 RepID=A0A6G4XSI4_9ACTN|nr:hypothetical protein [Streptomyces mesophilus]NGO79664.1 hypothetical protein [Streptomyces mesophilus]